MLLGHRPPPSAQSTGPRQRLVFWGMGMAWAEDLRMPGRGCSPGSALHCIRTKGPRPVWMGLQFSEDWARRFSCRQYKMVFRGISRLLNYLFASGTPCLCFFLIRL